MSTIGSTVVTGEDVIAAHFCDQACEASTLLATAFSGVAYVIELHARLDTEPPARSRRIGTVTVGSMTADGFVGRAVHQGAIRFSPHGTDLIVDDKNSGYLLMHATWITDVAYPA